MHLLSNLWSALWPNMVAPSIWTLFGIGLSHWHLRKHVNKKHDELHQKIDGIKP